MYFIIQFIDVTVYMCKKKKKRLIREKSVSEKEHSVPASLSRVVKQLLTLCLPLFLSNLYSKQ